MTDRPKSLALKEAYRFLETLFPEGLQDAKLMEELCPGGWEASPLRAAFHPSIERQYEEHLTQQENLAWFQQIGRDHKKEENIPPPIPPVIASFEEFKTKNKSSEKKQTESRENEFSELLGLCLWDILSDNHEVICAEGFVVELGSFRGAAGTISDFIAQNSWTKDTDPWDRGCGYLDFYLGTIYVRGRTPLHPIYALIFRRLKSLGADWYYSFPRISAISLTKPDALETDYSPSQALQNEQDEKEEARKLSKLNRNLDKQTLTDKREARSKPPPGTVAAYLKVYERFPVGWPPDPYDPH